MEKNLRKLNFGCGTRYADSWENIDFYSPTPEVQKTNLLQGLPYANDSFDVVYCSHVLEHFTKDNSLFLIKESLRILKKGGIFRLVVPDLEGSCREYIDILNLNHDDPFKQKKHEWIKLELLDQLVRMTPSGELGSYYKKIEASDDLQLKEYIRTRSENKPTPNKNNSKKTIRYSINRLISKWFTKLFYLRLKFVSLLLPKNLRKELIVLTSLGERHRWMYDQYELRNLFNNLNQPNIQFYPFNESKIPSFNHDCLDCLDETTPYKYNSIYCEIVKN
jgi:predicted SAM-dependent methyltransferase